MKYLSRTLLPIFFSAVLFSGCGSTQTNPSIGGNVEETLMKLTYELREDVTLEPVRYTNRLGITLAGHMFLPADIDRSKKYPAVLVGTPFGGVKEQGAGKYAMNLAERGYVVIAFDESFNGESGGEPRHTASPEVFVEDFSAGVDFLGTLPYVDRDRIGVIGICGSGGFSLKAAQVDPRIKAVVTASMYDISRVSRFGWEDTMTDEQRDEMLIQLGEQRWKDAENGSPEIPDGYPAEPADSIPEGLNPIFSEFFEYYGMKRGHHPNAVGVFTNTSSVGFINFPMMNYVSSISPRPIMFIMGENAHSRYFTEDAYELAAEPKELVIISGARHIDLYDREDVIPFDKIDSFFSENLK